MKSVSKYANIIKIVLIIRLRKTVTHLAPYGHNTSSSPNRLFATFTLHRFQFS